MKHLRKFNESTFDTDFIIAKIKEEFSEQKVAEMLDEEILEWTDEDWSDEHDSEYDWYIDHNNGEAQDVIIDQMINWYERNHNNLTIDKEIELSQVIKDNYPPLA